MEYLVLIKSNWMDLTVIDPPEKLARLAALRTNSKFEDKFNRRQKAGDIIEQHPDGYWTSPGSPGFRRDIFAVIVVKGYKNETKLFLPLQSYDEVKKEYNMLRKHEYSIDLSGLSIVDGFVSLNKSEFESRLIRHGG